MTYGLVLSTAPTTEPLKLDEAKKQVELVGNDAHDAHLENLITAARQYVERYTGRQLITATWDLYLDRFPTSNGEPIYVPFPPLISVTSITYTDTSGNSQTWSASNYRVSTTREPAWITPAYGQSYPSARDITDAVRVRYSAGYGAASAVPQALKAAMKLLIAHWFANREAVGNVGDEVPMAVAALLDSYRVGEEFLCYGPASYVTA